MNKGEKVTILGIDPGTRNCGYCVLLKEKNTLTLIASTDDEFYVDNTNLNVGDYIYKPDSTDKMAVSKSGTLIGVYNMNKGYADFKQITILAQNDEYAIVSSNTQYGLTVYDRIVLDASSVDNNQFTYK